MVVEVVAGLSDPLDQFPQFSAVDVHVDVDHSDGGVGHGAGDVGWFGSTRACSSSIPPWIASNSLYCNERASSFRAVSTDCRLDCPVQAVIRSGLTARWGCTKTMIPSCMWGSRAMG